MKEWESGARCDHLEYVKRRKGTYEKLNTLVWEWFNKAHSKAEAAYATLLAVLGDVRWDEYVAIDSSATTSDVVSDEWEAEIVAKAGGEVAAESDDIEEEEEEPTARTLISSREALDQVKKSGIFRSAAERHIHAGRSL